MKLLTIAALGTLLAYSDASAALIVVSADTTIGGASSLPAGNGQFFQDLLGTGTSVLIQELAGGAVAPGSNIANFYNLRPGVTATQTTAPESSLSGADLFISILPQTAYTLAELANIDSFLGRGGTLFLIGDSSRTPGGVAADPAINGVLASLGSAVSVGGVDQTAFAHAPQVGNFQYGFTTFVTSGTPSPSTSTSTSTVAPLIAVDTVPQVVEVQAVESMPEPASMLLFVSGLAGLGLLAHRRKKT